jgi:hypothetical protein
MRAEIMRKESERLVQNWLRAEIMRKESERLVQNWLRALNIANDAPQGVTLISDKNLPGEERVVVAQDQDGNYYVALVADSDPVKLFSTLDTSPVNEFLDLSGVIVSGAAVTAVNGVYRASYTGGNPLYTHTENSSIYIDYVGGVWRIKGGALITYYQSLVDVTYPWQVPTWQAGGNGSNPVPTVVIGGLFER